MSKYVYLAKMANYDWICAYDQPVSISPKDVKLKELGEYDSLTEFLRCWQHMICFEAEDDSWYIGNILDDIGEEFEDDMCYSKAKKVVLEARYGEG